MGHIHFDNLVKIYKNQVVRNMSKLTNPTNSICEQCQHGKQTRVHFKTKEHSSTKPLEFVHNDLCGPTKSKGLNGEKYFMLLIDDYTRMTWVCLLDRKSEAFGCFRSVLSSRAEIFHVKFVDVNTIESLMPLMISIESFDLGTYA